MQTLGDDFIDAGVIQFGEQATQYLFGCVLERAFGRARYGVQRLIRTEKTVANGAGKFAVQDQEIDHIVGFNRAKLLAVHFEGAGRFEQCRPLDIVKERAYVTIFGDKKKYLTSRMREVLSARSKSRPSRANCHASLCDMVLR